MAWDKTIAINKAFHGRAKLFGIELESSFEKFLHERLGGLLRESYFKLASLSSYEDEPGRSIFVRVVMSNTKDCFQTSYRIHIDDLFRCYEAAHYSKDFESHLIKQCFYHLTKQIEEELIKYIEKTPRQQRKINGGIREQEMISFSDCYYQSATANYSSYIIDTPTKSKTPTIEVDSWSPHKSIALLIGESKSRLDKGPFKNLNWKYEHFS